MVEREDASRPPHYYKAALGWRPRSIADDLPKSELMDVQANMNMLVNSGALLQTRLSIVGNLRLQLPVTVIPDPSVID